VADDDNHIRGPYHRVAAGDYSQAVLANGLIFVSGQYGADETGGVVSDDFREQAHATFANLGRVLAEAGIAMDAIVHLRCFLKRAEDFPIFKEVRRAYIGPPYPAASVICVPDFVLPRLLIEIEAVAKCRD
jgi:2-iminobutanoate/2-iminopropanoate deaminase